MKRSTLVLSVLVVIFLVVGGISFKQSTKVSVKKENSNEKHIHKEENEYNQDELRVYALKNQIDIYIKGSKQNSNKYLAYHIKRLINLEKDDSTPNNYDVWNISSVSEERKKMAHRRFLAQ